MALKQNDAVVFKGLLSTAKILRGPGVAMSVDGAVAAMAQQVSEFEAISKHRVVFLAEANAAGEFLDIIDLRKDFLRTRKPNDESLVLRTKIQSVPIEVKLVKDGEYSFDNKEVVSALRALADEVDGIEIDLFSLDNSDVRSLISGEDSDPELEQEDEDADSNRSSEE